MTPSLTIHKFPLQITDVQEVKFTGRIVEYLSVQVQNDELCLWAVVNLRPQRFGQSSKLLDRELPRRRVLVTGTGNPMPAAYSEKNSDWKYLGTVQTHGGAGVWHVFIED